ncbi:MAG: divalent-cation tolerance protein CutA [Nitrospirae bacterium]|nr:divalent-cation tolerance protein CutA [Nitrospirota bacterium]
MTDAIIVLMTASSREEAERISKTLVEEHLAVCVNVVPGARSCYFWEGKLCREGETLLIAKTRRDRFAALEARVRALHSYTVPEVLALSVVEGSEPYLRWLGEMGGGE